MLNGLDILQTLLFYNQQELRLMP